MENDDLPIWYNSYLGYKFAKKEDELKKLIYQKYLPILGKFIESMYYGLKFDIFIKERNSKQSRLEWYGHTYMELKIYDVISLPSYAPQLFSDVYRTPHYDGKIYYEGIFDDINTYIPEINKHLEISFVPVVDPYIEKYNMDFNSIPPFECWKEYFRMETTYANRLNSDWGR